MDFFINYLIISTDTRDEEDNELVVLSKSQSVFVNNERTVVFLFISWIYNFLNTENPIDV